MEQEILRIQPEKGPVSPVVLATATANTNSRVRRDELSARELWTQRDQLTGSQLPFNDEVVMASQAASRKRNQASSAKSKARNRGRNSPDISVGDLVYLVSERSKNQARDKYLVTSISGNNCAVRKFSRLHFRRKQYSVPLTGVYPITGGQLQPSPHRDQASDSSSDSDDNFDTPPAAPTNNREEEVSEEESLEEEEEVVGVVDVGDNLGRTRRRRREPDRHGDIVVGDQYERDMQEYI